MQAATPKMVDGTMKPHTSYTNGMKWYILLINQVAMVANPTHPHWTFFFKDYLKILY